MEEYNSIKGQSKKAKADRIALAERYLEEAAKL
jgi:hypothetical protein